MLPRAGLRVSAAEDLASGTSAIMVRGWVEHFEGSFGRQEESTNAGKPSTRRCRWEHLFHLRHEGVGVCTPASPHKV